MDRQCFQAVGRQRHSVAFERAFYRRTHKRPAVERTGPAPAVAEPPPPSTPRPEPQSGAAVLRVNGLSVAFGGVHALSDVDLEVREGELEGRRHGGDPIVYPNEVKKPTCGITGWS